jgi:hypothetical protein
MTELLRDSPDELGVLVARASAAVGIPAAYVEKDFWVTEVLRAASATRKISGPDGLAAEVLFVFKGGTSLNSPGVNGPVFGRRQQMEQSRRQATTHRSSGPSSMEPWPLVSERGTVAILSRLGLPSAAEASVVA